MISVSEDNRHPKPVVDKPAIQALPSRLASIKEIISNIHTDADFIAVGLVRLGTPQKAFEDIAYEVQRTAEKFNTDGCQDSHLVELDYMIAELNDLYRTINSIRKELDALI